MNRCHYIIRSIVKDHRVRDVGSPFSLTSMLSPLCRSVIQDYQIQLGARIEKQHNLVETYER